MVDSRRCPNCGCATVMYGHRGMLRDYCDNCGEKWERSKEGVWYKIQEGVPHEILNHDDETEQMIVQALEILKEESERR